MGEGKKDKFKKIVNEELSQNENPEESILDTTSSADQEPKKDLSSQEKSQISAVENDDLEKVDPRGLTEADFRYRPGFPWIKTTLFSLIIASLLYGLFLVIPTLGENARIHLSVREIDPNSPPAIGESQQIFPVGERLMVYFHNGRAIGSDTVSLRIYETYSSTDGSITQNIIAEHTLRIKPNYKTVYTAFQRDYFEQKGDYVLEILASSGPLASTKFSLQ